MLCIYINTLDSFKAGKGSQPTRSAAGNFFERSMEKNIPYLEGSWGGEVPRALTKKIYPMLFLKYLGPLVSGPA